MRRLRPSLGFKVGLRLGQGLRDESTETVLHFVTCGYLVRLMAHHPNHFKYHTHIIIDEVHERSIDADLLCMFTRQLLDRFPSIRLVLMSATLHTDLYKDYFSKFTYPLEPLFVGVKRFGIEYKYVNDVIAMAKQSKVPNNLLSLFEVLNKSTARCRGAQTVSSYHDYLLLNHLIHTSLKYFRPHLAFVKPHRSVSSLKSCKYPINKVNVLLYFRRNYRM